MGPFEGKGRIGANFHRAVSRRWEPLLSCSSHALRIIFDAHDSMLMRVITIRSVNRVNRLSIKPR